MRTAFNGDGHTKEIPGRKEGQEIKGAEDQDGHEQRDIDSLMDLSIFARACAHHSLHMQIHTFTHKKYQSMILKNVRCQLNFS